MQLFACVVTGLKMRLVDIKKEYLLKEGLPFRGHDESENSTRRENFLDLLKWYADRKEDVKIVVLKLRLLLKMSLIKNKWPLFCDMLTKKGQGYDEASSMWGEFNGLKTLIMKDTPSAYSVHWFAHQLQLTPVAVAKKHHKVDQFFYILANILNVIGGSFKRREMLRDDQTEKLLMFGEVHTRSELNQELGLQRAGDTRWSSHFKIVHDFIKLFSSIIHVLGILAKEGSNYQYKSLAKSLVDDIRSYELIYLLVKLSLILPVATATVERAFSLMKYIKNDMRSRIGDDFLNNCLVCYIENGAFENVPNEAIIDHFQNMTSR
ncbi:zinc finger MYM-type protein 1-like [Capsicum annuum]|uniref:zinc finger MYM-type protein 1-like n=1 Tax=Capsicum annuum TaxID=4072 RepID=UPI001FB0A2B2|nr:zinc finger MYM-type protein 1-like [Capsicum annuum]